jgi:hypothetical protein
MSVKASSTKKVSDLRVNKWAGWVWLGLPISTFTNGEYGTQLGAYAWDNTATDWNTGSGGGQYTYANFGTPRYAERIGTGSSSVSRSWTLYGSNDASTWTPVVNFTSPVTSHPALSYTTFTLQQWTYWKVQGGGDWTDPHTFRLEVFGG